MQWKIPLFKIYWDEDDVKAVSDAIKAGMHWAIGPDIEKFEKKISEYIGTKYCIIFNSGTSALHASLLASDIKKGDEIIVPSFTFIATVNAPLITEARPIFADIEEETLGLDPEDIKNKITKKTKAIIPVHYGGSPCKINEIKEIAEKKGILVIEDAAEAFGAMVGNDKVGTFGDSAMFSFCANKIITTGEGGCIVTDSNNIYEKLKLIRSHGRIENEDYFSSAKNMDYVYPGYNFRMSNILASLGLAQLKKVNKIIEKRRKIAEYLNRHLSVIDEVIVPRHPKQNHHVYQMYTIRVKNGKRDSLLNFLAERGIMTKVYFHPAHLTMLYQKKGYKVRLPTTEKISREVLTLPMYPSMTKEEINFIIDSVSDFFSR